MKSTQGRKYVVVGQTDAVLCGIPGPTIRRNWGDEEITAAHALIPVLSRGLTPSEA
jgi:hypothetical protein